MYIDRYAYMSKLKKTNPMQKFLFAVMTLTVCIWANSITVSVIVILMMGWMTVYKGGTSIVAYLKLLLIPASFVVISILTIVINASATQTDFLCSINIAGTYVGISNVEIGKIVRLCLKTVSTVSSLYFLSLTTPIVDLMAVLYKLKMPRILVEIMELTYRFIFILIEALDNMFTAQSSRLGYTSKISWYRSMAILVSSLFLKSYKRCDDMYIALESRGYCGQLNVLQEPFDKGKLGYFVIIAINVLLIVISIVV